MITLLFHWGLAIFRRLCIPGVNGSVIKEVRQGCACGLILFPASLASDARGDKECHLRSGSIWPNNHHKLMCFCQQRRFWPKVFPFRNSLTDCCIFRHFFLARLWVCYLCVSTENMALHFIHGVHPVCHGAEMEPPEHHLILSQSPWRRRGGKKHKTAKIFINSCQ